MITTRTDDALIAEVVAHAGPITSGDARRITAAVLAGLGARLSPADRAFVGEELPASLAAWLAVDPGAAVPIEALIHAPEVPVGRERELIASVCRMLASHLSDDAIARVRRALPESLAMLCAPPAPAAHAEAPGWRRTLARSHPGSDHPISAARPVGAQAGSIAEPDPHDATKLSTSPGSTQEREHDTLAEARGGPRTLSTARD